MNVVEVREVSFGYEQNQVLAEISMAVEKGDFLALLGPNGAGKTTLVKLILGLLKPLRGQVKLFGSPVEKFKNWSWIGYIPQKAVAFDKRFPVTVEEVVLAGRFGRLGLGRRPGKEDRQAVEEALSAMEILGYKKSLLNNLSGGQQQRVFIARALVSQPRLLILDEPVAGLDSRTLEGFYRLLARLNREKKMTILIVSHDTGAVSRWVNKVACVNHTLLYYGRPEELFRAEGLSLLYGAPVRLVAHG